MGAKVRESKESLDLNRYEQLTKPNVGYYPVTYFSSVAPDLFLYILRQFDPDWGNNHGHMSRNAVAPHAGTMVTEEN